MLRNGPFRFLFPSAAGANGLVDFDYLFCVSQLFLVDLIVGEAETILDLGVFI